MHSQPRHDPVELEELILVGEPGLGRPVLRLDRGGDDGETHALALLVDGSKSGDSLLSVLSVHLGEESELALG